MVIDVLILYEHVMRELGNALLLQKKLIQKGFTCEVRKAEWSLGYSNLKIRPKVIVVPWCYDNYEIDYFTKAWIGGYKDGAFKILNLHCEQISGESGDNFIVPKNEAKNVYHIAWGNHFYQALLSCGVDKEKICITGSPRLDVYRNDYRAINDSKEELAHEFGLDVTKKWVLLIGNFSTKDFTEKDLNIVEDRGYGAIRDMARVSRKTYDELINWFEYACQQETTASDVEFIYRPHPNEKLEKSITDLSEKYSNFHVIKNRTISDWIANSCIAFGWCSTSSIEVAASGIPIIIMRPFEIPQSVKIPIVEEIEEINNKGQFLEYVNRAVSGDLDGVNANFKKKVADYIAVKDRAAVDLTVDFIRKIYESDTGLYKSRYDYILNFSKTIKHLIKYAFISLGIKPKFIPDTYYNDVTSTMKEMDKYINRVNRIN